MKVVISGNEAFARGAYEAGVKVISSYPGTPSTEITEFASRYDGIHVEWATNEKVALEVVIGASMSGARTLTAMKHVGLNVAADPLMTFSYTGAVGGAAIIVADDPNMYSSQNEQDSRNFARFAKLPMLEPSDSAEAKLFVSKALGISEMYAVPVLVRSTTRLSHSMSVVELGERVLRDNKVYEKEPSRWVMVPAHSRKRHFVVEDRLAKLTELSGSFAHEMIDDRSMGIITSGVVYQYVKEALPEASILKLDMVWPLPMEKIREFSGKVEKLYVVEELDPVIETEVRAAGVKVESLNRSVCGELGVDGVKKLFGLPTGKVYDDVQVPLRPPALCAGCPHRGVFYALDRLKLTVLGDIGCYTLGAAAPLTAMDSCICMGASVSTAHGYDKGKEKNSKKSVGIIGDSTFLHTGINGLINSVHNKGASTLIILDNRITGMTGHQHNAASGRNIYHEPAPAINLEELCKAVGVKNIRKVDAFDPKMCMDVIKEELEKDEVSVILTDKPCIFADKTVIKPPYEVNREKCSGCRACVRIGCPAISWDTERKRAVIDELQCIGCGLCKKICRFDAISQVSAVSR